MRSSEEGAIRDAVRRWEAAASEGNVEDLKALWDFTYDLPVSVRDEFEEPLIGRDEISRECDYYAAITVRAKSVTNDVVVNVFGEYAVAFCVSVLQLNALGKSKPTCLVNRNTFIWRRMNEEWKLIHFHESPDPESDPRLGIVTPLPEAVVEAPNA